jgi:hypothetical protein
MDEPRRIDQFDRLLGQIDGLPDVSKAKPSTVMTVMPIIGVSQTYVVQTYKDRDEGFFVFLQVVDGEGRARLAIPPKVAAAIYRQRESLVKRARSRAGRDRYDRMTPAQRQASVTRLHKGRRKKAG